MVSPEQVLEDLENQLPLGDEWEAQFVRDDHGKNVELYLGEPGHETALLEVIRGDVATVIDVYHIDYPETAYTNMDIPGHIDVLSFENWNEALDALHLLANEENLSEIVDLVLSDETQSSKPLQEAFEQVKANESASDE